MGYKTVIVKDSPLAYYRLNEDYGVNCVDLIGGYDGTYSGSPLLQQESNICDSYSVKFDGSSWVSVPSDGVLNLNDKAHTVEVWIKIDSNSVVQPILAKGTTVGSYSFYYRVNSSGKLSASNGAVEVAGSTTLAADTWYHALFAYSGTAVTIYLNGVPDGSGTIDLGTGNDLSMLIGRSGLLTAPGDPLPDYLTGSLDEVVIYERELAEHDAIHHYEAGQGSYTVSVLNSDPFVYYKFDETTGAVADDVLGLNDGAYVNNPTLNQTGLITTGASVLFTRSNSEHVTSSVTQLLSSGWSAECWFNASSAPNGEALICESGGSVQVAFAIAFGSSIGAASGSNIYAGLYASGSWGGAISAEQIVTGKTYHVVGTYNGSTIKLYLNGNLVASQSVAKGHPDLTSTMYIGRRWDNTGTEDYFDGYIDEPTVYARALTPYEVKLHFADGLRGLKNITTYGYEEEVLLTAPIAYWKLDDATSTATDQMGLQNGTYIGSPTQEQPPLPLEGNSVLFNGTSQCVRISNSDTPVGDYLDSKDATAVTMEAWVKLTALSTTESEYIFVSSIDGTKSGFTIYCSHLTGWSVGGRSVTTDVFQSISAGTLPNENCVYHIVGVLDFANKSGAIYVNGELANSGALTFANNSYTVGTPTNYESIGADGAQAAQWFDGHIDEVSIYPYAKSANDVAIAWQKGAGRTNDYDWEVMCDGPKLYFPLNGHLGNFLRGNTDMTMLGSASHNESGLYPFYNDTIDLPSSVGSVNVAGQGVTDWMTAGSMELWLYYTGSGSTFGRIAYLGQDGGGTMIGINKSSIGIYITRFGQELGNTALEFNKWHHIVLTHDGTNEKLYVNGKLAQTVNMTGYNISVDDFVFGGYQNEQCWTRNSNGAFYDYELSARQVQNHFCSMKLKHNAKVTSRYFKHVMNSAPTAYYPMTERLDCGTMDATDPPNTTAQWLGTTYKYCIGPTFELYQAREKTGNDRLFDDSISLTAFNTTGGSIECWFRVDEWDAATGTQDQRIFAVGNTADNAGYITLCRSGTAATTITVGVGGTNTGALYDITLGEWYQAVVTANPVTNTLRLYINGAFTTSGATISWNLSATECHFGGSNDGRGSMSGGISNCAVYNYILSDIEISNHFNAAQSTFFSLKRFHRMICNAEAVIVPTLQQTSGSTVTDLSTRSNNLTLINSPTVTSNGYLTFNGTNDYANFGTGVQSSTEWTLFSVSIPDTEGTYHTLCSRRGTGSWQQSNMLTYGGVATYEALYVNTSNAVVSAGATGTYSAGQFYAFGASLDSTTGLIARTNISTGTGAAGTPYVGTYETHISHDPFEQADYPNSAIKLVILHSHSFSAEEVDEFLYDPFAFTAMDEIVDPNYYITQETTEALTFSGLQATVQGDVDIQANTGSITTTGKQATLILDTTVWANKGTITVTGKNAEIVAGLEANSGTVTFTGITVEQIKIDKVIRQTAPASIVTTGLLADIDDGKTDYSERRIDQGAAAAWPFLESVAGVATFYGYKSNALYVANVYENTDTDVTANGALFPNTSVNSIVVTIASSSGKGGL